MRTFPLRINSETYAGAGRVIERNMESEWRHSHEKKTVPLLILPWQWSASWRIAVWWISATHSVHLTSRQPIFVCSIKLKPLPKGGKLWGRLDVKNNLTAESNAVIFDHSKAVICNIWRYGNREITLKENKVVYLLFIMGWIPGYLTSRSMLRVPI